jgi:polyhydroxyalkanoate synthase subunit PhaC
MSKRGHLTLVKARTAVSARAAPVRTAAKKRATSGAGVSVPAPAAGPSQDPSFARDSYASTAFADIVDRSLHAATARFTAGLSPIALA